MAGEGEEIAVHIADIDFHMRDALRAVDHDDCTDAVGLFDDFLDIILEAEHVRDLRHCDDFRLFRDFRLDILVREVAVFLKIDVLEDSTRRFGNELPRHEVAVMLRNRDDDFIAGLDVVQAIAVSHEVQRFRRVLREDDFGRTCGIDEFRCTHACIFVNFRCLDGKSIGAAVRIGIAAAIVAADGLDDLFRLLRRRAIIEISNLLPVHLPLEEREVFQKFLCISHSKVSSANTYQFLS